MISQARSQLQKLLPRSPHGESFPPNIRRDTQSINYGIRNSEGIAVKTSGISRLVRLFIFTFLAPGGFIWAFGQESPSGSSAGVSWGLRRGNYRVISQSDSVQVLFLSRFSFFFPSTPPFLLLHKLSEFSSELPHQCDNLKSMLIHLVYLENQSVRKRTCFLLHFLSQFTWSPWHLGIKQIVTL